MTRKKKVIFMLQNGIGFGHFKLALTISNYLKNNCEIFFITQAKSTLIFDEYDYKVYNFPMLYTLKTNNEILIMNRILNSLIETIQPDLIIEDTYPEDFYLNLPALKNISKILIMNRLTASEFENLYFNGVINQYDKLIVLKDKECFINDITSKEVRNYVNFSKNVVYLSGVFNEPTDVIKKSIRQKYSLDQYEKNIVVNCGAGGWHIGKNICEEIFEKTIQVTKKLVDNGRNIQTILVLGPYSKYLKEKFKEDLNSHIKVMDFETHLDALFQIVDLVILRPGYNSTMEAIAGNANILLLPGISYMEDQDIWCKELSQKYGIDFLNVNELEKIEEKITSLLRNNMRTPLKPFNNTKHVANEILSVLNYNPLNTSISLIINNLKNSEFNIIPENLENIVFLKEESGIVLADRIPVLNMSDLRSNEFDNYDAFIVYNDINLELKNATYYESRYHLKQSGYIILEYQELNFRNTDQLLNELTAIIKNNRKFNNNIVINISSMEQTKIIEEIINPLSDFILNNDISIINFKDLLNNTVNCHISSYQYGYYRPEIAKLS